jgi:hypothetical protein
LFLDSFGPGSIPALLVEEHAKCANTYLCFEGGGFDSGRGSQQGWTFEDCGCGDQNSIVSS